MKSPNAWTATCTNPVFRHVLNYSHDVTVQWLSLASVKTFVHRGHGKHAPRHRQHVREIVAIAREMEALQLALGVHVMVRQHLRRGRSVRACAYTAISRAARYPQPRVRRVLHGVQRGVRLERRELVHRVACVHALHCRYTSPLKYSRWCQWRLYASNMRHCILAKFRERREKRERRK